MVHTTGKKQEKIIRSYKHGVTISSYMVEVENILDIKYVVELINRSTSHLVSVLKDRQESL